MLVRRWIGTKRDPQRDGAGGAGGQRRRGASARCLALFVVLLVLAPLLRPLSAWIAMFDAFFRSGALVFGGGGQWRCCCATRWWRPAGCPTTPWQGMARRQVPGAGVYLRRRLSGSGQRTAPGAVLALVAIFLPGILLMTGTLPFWDALRTRPAAQAAMRGINAAVVGVLGAALYDPVWTTTVLRPADFALALAGFVLLTVWRAPPLLVVGLGALAGIALAALGSGGA